MSPSIMEDDVDADYFATSSPSEQRGRWLSAQEAMEETEMHPVQPNYGNWLCLASMIVSVVAVLLSALVLAQVYLLPDATVWPLGVAALICAAAAGGLGWFGVRGRS